MKGRKNKVVGSVKEVAGKVTGNRSMERKGRIQKNLGKGEAAYGDLKKDVS